MGFGLLTLSLGEGATAWLTLKVWSILMSSLSSLVGALELSRDEC